MAGLKPRIGAVIPTVGASPYLNPCLEALRRDGGRDVEITVVDQAPTALTFPAGLVDRVLRPGKNLGFAASTNLGISASDTPLVATINDDVVLEPGWCASLVEALESNRRAAAVQGIQVCLGDEGVIDGCGLALDRWWQAQQSGHGEEADTWEVKADRVEIFGVSATAALYRRSALERVLLPGGRGPSQVFDAGLGSYYEDVDLACRLRAAGYRAFLVGRTRAAHAGSVTGRRQNLRRLTQLRGNRYLVMARLLGRTYWLRLPRMLERDLRDLLRLSLRGEIKEVAGVFLGLGRAACRLHRYLHLGAPSVSLDEAQRFQPGDRK